MVRRKTTKKPMAKKRVYRRKRRYSRNKPAFIPYSHLPLGQSQLVRSRYLENLQLSTTAGVPAVYTFQVNSVYDPNFSGTGHQPIGHDQMNAIFNQACVVGAKVNLRCWNRDTDEYVGFAIYFSEFAANPISTVGIQGLLEQGALKYVILPPATTGGGGMAVNLNARVSTKKFFHVKDLLDSSEYSSIGGNNPAKGIFMHVIMWQPDGGITSAGGSFYLTLDQLTVWRVPKNLPQS